MIKSMLIASALVGALAIPALAHADDYRFEGGNGGYQDGGGYGDRGGPDYRQGGDGYGRPRGDYRPAPIYTLGPRQIARALRSQGYRNIEIVNQRRDVTIARAMARGRDFILVVDARSGDVLRRRSADDGWRGDRGWHGGWGNDWRRW
jgi:hypothetical protein